MTRFFNFALLLCLGASICLATVVTNRLVENKLTPVRMEDRVCEVSKEGFPEKAIEIVNILNVNSDNFLDDFAIEVRNISDKPIYSIYLAGLFPNSGKIINQSAGFAMFYGDPSLIDRSNHARPEDKPINPGDTAQIKIFKKIAEGYKESLRIGKHPISVFSKIVVRFQTLNFGDGTGYSLSDYVDKTKKISLYKPSSISSPVRSFLVSNSTSFVLDKTI